MITSDIQQAYAGKIIELFEVDLTTIGISEHYYFHNGVNELGDNVVFNGIAYIRYPIEAGGFERNGNGKQPRPTIKIANADGSIGTLSRANNDLVKAKVIRRRTFMKYLDAVNFTGGVNPTADPNAALNDEIWYIDRKTSENKIYVEWELVSGLDLENSYLPKRQCIQNVCVWKYRSAECSYAGGAVANKNDQITSVLSEDDCGKRVSSCKLRFPNQTLPFGGFPAITLIR